MAITKGQKFADLQGEVIPAVPWDDSWFRKMPEDVRNPSMTEMSDGTMGSFMRISGGTWYSCNISKRCWTRDTDITWEIKARFTGTQPANDSFSPLVVYNGEYHYTGIYHYCPNGVPTLVIHTGMAMVYASPFTLTSGQIYTYKISYNHTNGQFKFYLDGTLLHTLSTYTGWKLPFSIWMFTGTSITTNATYDIGQMTVTTTNGENKKIWGSTDAVDLIWNSTGGDNYYDVSKLFLYSSEEGGTPGGVTSPYNKVDWGYAMMRDFACYDCEEYTDFAGPVVGEWSYQYPDDIKLPENTIWSKIGIIGTQSGGYIKFHVTDSDGNLLSDSLVPNNSVGFYPQGLSTPLEIDISKVNIDTIRWKVVGNYDGSARTYSFACPDPEVLGDYTTRQTPSILHGMWIEAVTPTYIKDQSGKTVSLKDKDGSGVILHDKDGNSLGFNN